jgi:hypothetical protein
MAKVLAHQQPIPCAGIDLGGKTGGGGYARSVDGGMDVVVSRWEAEVERLSASWAG